MSESVVGFFEPRNAREKALVQFLWESEDLINSIEQALACLESEGANLELIERLHYLAYRLHEGAEGAGLDEVTMLARVIENVFEQARRGQVELTSDLISLLIPTCGALRRMTEGVGAEERAADREETPESEAVDAVAVSAL